MNDYDVIVYAGRYEIQFRKPNGERYTISVPLGWEKPHKQEKHDHAQRPAR